MEIPIITKIVTLIINPAIIVLFAWALLVFVWGLARFILKSNDASERAKGKSHMIWGVVGFVIMFSAYVIVNLLGGWFDKGAKTTDTWSKYLPL